MIGPYRFNTSAYEPWCVCVSVFLLGEDDEPDELLGADLSKALTSTRLPQIGHEIKDRLATQHLVAHVDTHHDGRLVMQDGAGVAWPDGQPKTDGRAPWLLVQKPSFNTSHERTIKTSTITWLVTGSLQHNSSRVFYQH